MAKSIYSKVDEYGFERPANFNYNLYDKFMSQYIRILTRRTLRWNLSIKENVNYTITNSTLKRFIRKGIPIDRRIEVWMKTSGAEHLRQNSTLTYQQLKANIANQNLIETIKIDLPRTFPDNIYFTNHEYLPTHLFNVLATFAHQNAQVGYCQGLNYIAGLLLLVTKDEEVSFWLLKALIEKILPSYYISTMSGLLVDLDVLNELIEKSNPALHRHIQNVGMPWAMGTTKWFICLYSEVLPTETVLRIWDCLFYEGSKIILRVAVTLIKIHEEAILQCGELGELTDCFRGMRNHENVIDCHRFMNDIFRIPGSFSNKKIEKLRNKYAK